VQPESMDENDGRHDVLRSGRDAVILSKIADVG
jgi:hypothetical protein